MKKSSADGSDTGKLSELFAERNTVKSQKVVKDWVNSPTAGNVVNVANEPNLHLAGTIAQSKQANAIRTSSAQPLYSHPLDLNTHGQNKDNINLLSIGWKMKAYNMNFAIDNAPFETNIFQEQQQT